MPAAHRTLRPLLRAGHPLEHAVECAGRAAVVPAGSGGLQTVCTAHSTPAETRVACHLLTPSPTRCQATSSAACTSRTRHGPCMRAAPHNTGVRAGVDRAAVASPPNTCGTWLQRVRVTGTLMHAVPGWPRVLRPALLARAQRGVRGAVPQPVRAVHDRAAGRDAGLRPPLPRPRARQGAPPPPPSTESLPMTHQSRQFRPGNGRALQLATRPRVAREEALW